MGAVFEFAQLAASAGTRKLYRSKAWYVYVKTIFPNVVSLEICFILTVWLAWWAVCGGLMDAAITRKLEHTEGFPSSGETTAPIQTEPVITKDALSRLRSDRNAPMAFCAAGMNLLQKLLLFASESSCPIRFLSRIIRSSSRRTLFFGRIPDPQNRKCFFARHVL